MNKLVSIIIPVYNVENYIEECIESALNQTYKNIEIIVIDDGSTDNSLEILKKYKDINIFTQKNDGAPGKARNLGIEKSKGDYLFFLDADDYLSSQAIEILVKEINDSDLVIGRTIWTDGEKEWYPLREKKLSLKNKVYDLRNIRYYDFEKLSYIASGRLFKKNIVKENNILFPHKFSSQDTYFSIFYNLRCRRIKVVEDVVYYRRERNDVNNKSQVQTVTEKSISGRLSVSKMIVEDLMKIDESLAYYWANVLLNSNFNRLNKNNLKEIMTSFDDYIEFYLMNFNKKFYSSQIILDNISDRKYNNYRKYINFLEKYLYGKMRR